MKIKSKKNLIILIIIIVCWIPVVVLAALIGYELLFSDAEYLTMDLHEQHYYSDDRNSLFYNGKEYQIYEGSFFFNTLCAPRSYSELDQYGLTVLSWDGLRGHADVLISYSRNDPFVIYNKTTGDFFYIKGYSFQDDIFSIKGTDISFSIKTDLKRIPKVYSSFEYEDRGNFSFFSKKYPQIIYNLTLDLHEGRWICDDTGASYGYGYSYVISSDLVSRLKATGVIAS